MKRRSTIGLPRPSVVAAWIAVLFLGVAVLASNAGTASAKSEYLGSFNALYSTAGTPLDSCSLCHTNIPSLNAYGADWTNNGKSFPGIEGLDSDSDGWSNIVEIQARSLPGDAASTPPPVTTTTQPGTTTTTQPPTTTTQPVSTTLPPPGSGPVSFNFKEFDVPGSVDVTGGSTTRQIKIKVEVDNASGANVTATIQLWANGALATSTTQTRESEDNGEVEYETTLSYTFTAADVPRVDWWAIVVIDGQSSSPATASTTVTGPPPPTTTQPPPTTQPPTTSTTQPPTTPTTPPPGGVDGAAIYAASCAGCHGSDGSGGFGGPVAGTSMSLGQVITITADGGGGMPGFSSQLSGAEIDAVAAFVLTLGTAGEPPPTTTTTLPPGTSPGSGSALYRQHCASCHGTNAEGGAGGPLVGSSLSFAQQVSVTSQGVGGMPGFSSVLTGSEIESIIRYVQGLGGPGSTTTTVPSGEESGAAIYTRLCVACHGAGGSGGSGGPIAGTAYAGLGLAGVISNGVGTMPGFASQLDTVQLNRLVAYVEGLGGGASGTEIGADGEEVNGFAGSEGFDVDSFPGHQSAGDGSGDILAQEANPASVSPLPVGNPVGWSLALAIAALFVAVGSAITGAMPTEIDDAG